MITPVYLVLVVSAVGTLLLLLTGALPNTMGSAISIVLWLAVIPASYDIEVITDSGALESTPEPVMVFVGVAGLGVSALYLFADVTGQLGGTDGGLGARGDI